MFELTPPRGCDRNCHLNRFIGDRNARPSMIATPMAANRDQTYNVFILIKRRFFMTDHSAVVLSKNSALSEQLEKRLASSGVPVFPFRGAPTQNTLRHKPCRVAIIEKRGDWQRNLDLFEERSAKEEAIVIIGSSKQLTRAMDLISRIAIESTTSQGEAHALKDPALRDLLEHRLTDFVKKMKAGGGRNLYALLLREIERPLINLVLKETNWNQVRAAQMLGLNRNTLRKKIRELHIPIPKPL